MGGEPALKGKIPPYEEGIRVPMVIRYDPLTASPREDWSLALNIDLAPTFADLAGVIPPSVDGSSLVPLLGNPQAQWRSDFLVEHLEDWPRIPTYCAVRNQQYMYIDYQYQEGQHEEELYDLTVDPYELDNRATDPT